ncbi:hypothetical protein BEN47_13520 [Hymenobacter lapidarius]|uniref:Uncharacterized protein n=1 Tax=Hymenobacter lapidarius TaxID=1908237 RepID=A0A1G1T5G0_9BACT|nr:hypothetical protein [Hymenobacter lapidarius]OGX86115.1 hypothetical protein BEN47_13520 [Hymenobacter lapidarius]
MPSKPELLVVLLLMVGCKKAKDEPISELKGHWDRVRIDNFYYNAAGRQLATASGPGVAAYITIKDSTIEYFQTGNTTLLIFKYKRVGNQLLGTRITGPQDILELTPHRLKLHTGNIMVQRGDTARFEYDESFVR